MDQIAQETCTTWAPEKCVVPAKTDPKLEIDGVRLPHEQTFKYFGVLIGYNG